jgi:hypothetical protein
MARPTCDEIIENQLKFLVDFADAIGIELYAGTPKKKKKARKSKR